MRVPGRGWLRGARAVGPAADPAVARPGFGMGVGRVRAGGGTGHVTRMIIVDTEFAIYDLDRRKS